MATTAVIARICRSDPIFVQLSMNEAYAEPAKSFTTISDRSSERRAIPMASPIRLQRMAPLVLPNTFCVLMLRRRTGVSAMEKLTKLTMAIPMISTAMASNDQTVVRLLLGVGSNRTFFK